MLPPHSAFASRLQHFIGLFVAAILGAGAMCIAPPMTITYPLSGGGRVEYSWHPFLVLFLLLVVAGLLVRLVFTVSPWMVGPSTALCLIVWCVAVTTTGEDAADYRHAWWRLIALIVAASMPGTLAARAVEMFSRGRHHSHRG